MAAPTPGEAVARVRRFTRFYTRRIGVLQGALLGSAFNLAEGRIVYEIAVRAETTASDLASALDLDAGYVSRLVKGLERRGFLTRRASTADARQQILELTPKGQAAFEPIDQRSDHEVRALLRPLGAGARRRLIGALTAAEELLSAAPSTAPACILRDLRVGDISWIVHRHAVLYAREYGWDRTFEAMVAKVGAEFIDNFVPGKERGWIAELDGRPVGSVLLVRKSDTVAKLRLLYVEPAARGHGIGRRLVEACIDHARGLGYERMTLWTNDILVAARRIYETTGFKLMHSEPHVSFGQRLVGETWERDL